MSWYRYFAALAAVVLLAGCGFSPLYGTNRNDAPMQRGIPASIAIGNIPDARGQYLRNALIDRLYREGRPSSPAYTLTIAPLTVSQTDIGIGKDASITRVQTEISTTIRLQDSRTGKTLLERFLRTSGGHNIFAGQYATLVAEETAENRQLDDLATRIERELALYFSGQAQQQP